MNWLVSCLKTWYLCPKHVSIFSGVGQIKHCDVRGSTSRLEYPPLFFYFTTWPDFSYTSRESKNCYIAGFGSHAPKYYSSAFLRWKGFASFKLQVILVGFSLCFDKWCKKGFIQRQWFICKTTSCMQHANVANLNTSKRHFPSFDADVHSSLWSSVE